MSLSTAEDESRASERTTTSAGRSMLDVRPGGYYIIALGPPFDPGTASNVLDPEAWEQFELESQHTSSGYASGERATDRKETGSAILELRRLTGLTWDQLARLFRVARRSLHFWASGKPLNAANEEQLYRALATIRAIDRGNAGENRALLLQEIQGRIPIDLLAEGRYEEVLNLVGGGPGRAQRELRALSPEEQAARAPLPPEVLADALQERVHDERSRPRSDSSHRSKRDG